MDLVRFETLGCKLNQIETESLAAAFAEAGFSVDHGHAVADAGPEGEAATTADDQSNASDLPGSVVSAGQFRSRAVPPELCVVNTCTVTGKAEQKARRLIRLLLTRYPSATVLVTGCYAEVEEAAIAAIGPRVCVYPGSRKGELAAFPAWLSARRLKHPEEPIHASLVLFRAEAAEAGISPVAAVNPASQPPASGAVASDVLVTAATTAFSLSTDDFRFHSRASIKIQDGCGNRCSYCRIRLARGTPVSLAADEVVERIRAIEAAGWAEVILAGVNLSQYRSRFRPGELSSASELSSTAELGLTGDFADLLRLILHSTERIALRVSSLYPERVDEALAPLIANPRVRPHFHLSVQSGSDRVLALMRRPYSASAVIDAVARLRRARENPFIACDIITGFPGETAADFAQTLELCREARFAWIHAFPFSPRPGTEAWSMKPRVPERVAGERVAALTALAEENRREYAAYWVNRPLRAIVEQSRSGGPLSVLTENYLAATLDSLSHSDSSIRRGAEITVLIDAAGRARAI